MRKYIEIQTIIPMKKILVALSLLIFGHLSMQAQKQVQEMTFHFPTDQHQLKEFQKEKLKGLIDSLENLSFCRFIVEGHTDARGDSLYNRKLSRKRSKAVYRTLDRLDIPGDSIDMKWFGETRPVADNKTPEGRQNNRRAEVLVFREKKQQVQDRKVSIQSLYNSLQASPQTFQIRPGSDTLLAGRDNTLLGIQSHLFDVPDSLRGRLITIQLTEVYEKPAMLLHNLQTKSGGKLLETAGMINIQAEVNGTPVQLLPGKSIEVITPARPYDEKMRLFSGRRDSLDHMDWQLSGEALNASDNMMFLGCTDNTTLGTIPDCPFFFCKIKRFFMSSEEKAKLRKKRQERREEIERKEELCENRQKAYERYERKYGPLDAQKLRKMKQQKSNMKSYLFEASQLGWHNLDKFAKVPEEKRTNLRIGLKPDMATDVHLVFKKRKSVVSAQPGKKSYMFRGIPKGEEVYVLAFRALPDQEMRMALKELTTGRQHTLDPELNKTGEEEIKERLRILKNFGGQATK